MESSAAVVPESPRDKEEAKEKEITIDGSGNIKSKEKPVVAIAVVAAVDHGKVANTISPAKTASPKENKKTKKKKNEAQVSNTKKPFIFYLNLAKRHINQYKEVELCGLGMAIPTVITIAEILKQNGLAIQEGIKTSTAPSKEVDKRQIEKARIEIVLGKAEKHDKNNNAAFNPKEGRSCSLVIRRHNKQSTALIFSFTASA